MTSDFLRIWSFFLFPPIFTLSLCLSVFLTLIVRGFFLRVVGSVFIMVPAALRCKSFLVCMQEVIREQNHGDELDEHTSEVGGILM